MRDPGLWLLVLCVLSGCSGEEDVRSGPPTSARWDIVEALRADGEARRHPSDGGGRVRIDGGSGNPQLTATVSRPGTWSFVFETGPEGISEGGWIFFQAPPFWGWSAPQTIDQSYPGFTEIFMHPVPRGIPIMETLDAVTEEINAARDYLDRCLAEI